MATTQVAGSYDSELAQFMARQKRTSDQDRGAADAADADAYKKLMGKFGGAGIASDSVAGNAQSAGDAKPSSIGLDPAAPGAKAAEEPPPPPPTPKKEKSENCLDKTFGFIGKILQVAIPAVVGFFTGGPVGAVLGAAQGVSSLAEQKA